MELQQFFEEHPKAAIAFSGGVDSSWLLCAALRCGADVKPYCAISAFQPAFEREDALEICRMLGTELTFVELDVLSVSKITENPADRCYHCKTAVFTALRERAEADGYTLLLDGTNASDREDDRPGMRALKELGVLSPNEPGGRTSHLVEARLCLPCHAHPHGGEDHGGKAPKGGESGRRPARHGLQRPAGAPLARRGAYPAPRGTDGRGRRPGRRNTGSPEALVFRRIAGSGGKIDGTEGDPRPAG